MSKSSLGGTNAGKSRRRSVDPSERPGPSLAATRGPESSAEDEGLIIEEEWESEDDDDDDDESAVASSVSMPQTPKSGRRRPNAVGKSKGVIIPRSPRGQQLYNTSRAITPALAPLHEDELNPQPRRRRRRAPEEPQIPWEEIPRHATSTFKATIIYVLDVLTPALKLMKYPLILIVFLLTLATVLNSVAEVFKAAFSPFCFIPGVNNMAACQWIKQPHDSLNRNGGPGKEVQRADYPALIDLEAKTFDQLVDDSMGVAGSLSLNLKKTEVATKDLISLVKISELASKDLLAETLVEFTNDAKVTSEGLNRLAAKFNGALDNIMAVNDFALHSVAKARNSEPQTLGEQINAVMPWAPPRKDVDAVVVETFKGAMDMLSTQLERLILFAEASSRDLGKLEETLTTLYEIVQRENNTIAIDKDELLQQLWTRLGGNRKEMKSFERHLKLLKELANYKKQAQAHVVAALHTLQGMSQEMDDIRERVAAPDLSTPQIAPEVHMKSIQLGLERLKESRIRAKELDHQATKKILGIDEGTLTIEE